MSYNTKYYREEYYERFNDSDRYVTDRYDLLLSMLGTSSGYSISCQINSVQLGISSYIQYWHYSNDEINKAKNTFKEIKKTSSAIRNNVEFNRQSMTLVISMFKSKVNQIDIEHQETSGVPSFNWSKLIVTEPDWRETIYGKRYPSPKITTNNEQVYYDQKPIIDKKSLQDSKILKTSDTHWKMSWTNQNYIRSILDQNHLSNKNIKYSQINEQISNIISRQWGISSSLAKSFLMWFLSVGGSSEVLLNRVQAGETPQKVVQSVPKKNKSSPTGKQTQIYQPPIPPKSQNNSVQTNQSTDKKQISVSADKKLEGLDTEFKQKVINVLLKLEKMGWQPKIAEGVRTIEQQKEKVQKGYSKTLKSKHLSGLAVDIIDKRYGWQHEASDKNFKFWTDLGKCAKEEGLIWGGDWEMQDVAHIEVSTKNKSS